jgi:hypothetical protein
MTEVGSSGLAIMMCADTIVIMAVRKPATLRQEGRCSDRRKPRQVLKSPFSEINELALTKP